jgi:hypothetical protein
MLPHSPQMRTLRLFPETREISVLNEHTLSLSSAFLFAVYLYPARVSNHFWVSLILAASFPTEFSFFCAFFTHLWQVLHGLSILFYIDFTIFKVKLQLLKAFSLITLISCRKWHIFIEKWKSQISLTFRHSNLNPFEWYALQILYVWSDNNYRNIASQKHEESKILSFVLRHALVCIRSDQMSENFQIDFFVFFTLLITSDEIRKVDEMRRRNKEL